MTDEQIKELALQHGFTPRPTAENGWDLRPYVYEFARAIIAAEREACAEACETNNMSWADTVWNNAVTDCAAKIRARSNM